MTQITVLIFISMSPHTSFGILINSVLNHWPAQDTFTAMPLCLYARQHHSILCPCVRPFKSLDLIPNLVTLSGLTDNNYPDILQRQAVCSLSQYLPQVGLFTSPTQELGYELGGTPPTCPHDMGRDFTLYLNVLLSYHGPRQCDWCSNTL